MSTSFKLVLGAVLLCAVLAFLVLQQVNFLVGRSLLIAFGNIESTYRGAWFEWDGDVSARDVVVYPFGRGEADLAVRFERMSLDTPGWLWFLRNTFDRKLQVARIDHLRITLTGVRSEAGLDPSLGDLGPIGAASASPFEAEGCLQDGMWVPDELLDMGLDPGPTTLTFDYRIEGQALLTRVTLDTPGASRAELERRERLPREINALLIDQFPSLVEHERWHVVDKGFVQARNAWCAKKDGVDEATFVERHVESVSRLLETVGLAPDAGSIETYRAFAADGGEIAFGGQYVRPLPGEELYDLHDSGEALTRMHGMLERQRQRVAVTWRRFDPRPLAGLEESASTYEALLKERGVAPAGTAKAPAVRVETVTDASGRRITRIQTPAVSHANLVSPGQSIDWAELAGVEGRWIRVWTRHNPPRHVQVLDFNGRALQVRANLGGGYADYRISRESYLRAVLVR